MEVWKDVELYEQGLRDFQSLTPLQRDWFVIKNIDIYYEMEGGFQDYVPSGGSIPQMAWLEAALGRLGDLVSLGIISRLRGMGESKRAEMEPLCRAYYERRQLRWQLLESRLKQQGVRLDESP